MTEGEIRHGHINTDTLGVDRRDDLYLEPHHQQSVKMWAMPKNLSLQIIDEADVRHPLTGVSVPMCICFVMSSMSTYLETMTIDNRTYDTAADETYVAVPRKHVTIAPKGSRRLPFPREKEREATQGWHAPRR